MSDTKITQPNCSAADRRMKKQEIEENELKHWKYSILMRIFGEKKKKRANRMLAQLIGSEIVDFF